MGIRLIISFISMASLITVSVVIVLITLAEQNTITQDTLGERLESVATNLGNDLFPVLTQPDVQEINVLEYLLRLSAYDDIYFAYITDKDNNLISLYRGESLPVSWRFTPRIENSYTENNIHKDQTFIVTRQPIGEQISPIGSVVIVENISTKLSESQSRLLWGISPLLVGCFVVIGLITILAISRFSSPIVELSQQTLNIARSRNFSQRISALGTKEVRKLSGNINFLLRKIDAQLRENKDKNRQLVEQRDEMERLANFDVLTSLPNRQFVLKSLDIDLANATRAQSDFAILFFDLDGFKNINDSMGHNLGDMVLVQVAKRVKSHLRDGDLFARLGGDEFLVRIQDDSDMKQLETIGRRLSSLFNELIAIEHWKLDVKVSIGIARATDARYDLQTLLSYADTAMYQSKKRGRGQVSLFDGSMLEEVQKKMKIRTLLKHAIENNELYPVLQPRVGRDGYIKSFEFLCRWQSPELGFVAPDEFITIAEQSNLISDITQWMMQQALEIWQKLAETYGDDLRISINVSTKDIRNKKMFSALLNDAKTKGIPANTIELEITETSYLQDLAVANSFCDFIQGKGCHIAIDDFGTGYSSLGVLSQINFNTIKIDRSFVSDIGKSKNADAIIKTIIQLAQQLGANTCAEGVETEQQKEFLLSHGVDELQGYLLGKPKRTEQWIDDEFQLIS